MKNLKKNAGFTLVELIVVIAILGILAGVGTVAYTGYVEKANKAVDEQLVADVKYAIQLAQASRSIADGSSGYVALTKTPNADGKTASASADVLAAAMAAAFGEEWETSLKLKNDWSIKSSVLEAALAGNGQAVINSSYITNSSITELLDNVQTVTSAAAGLLGTVAKTEEQYIAALQATLGEDYLKSAVKAGILESETADGKTTYSFKSGSITKGSDGKITLSADLQNQLANLMVFSVANELKDANSSIDTYGATDMEYLMINKEYSNENNPGYDSTKYSGATVLASRYALYKAYALDSGNVADFNNLNTALNSATGMDDVKKAFSDYETTLSDAFTNYYQTEWTSKVQGNSKAFTSIMNGVNAVSDDYATADSLKDGTLFTSGAVSGDVNTFVGACSLTENDVNALKALGGGIVVFLSGDAVYATTD